jgi:hypothetical protein
MHMGYQRALAHERAGYEEPRFGVDDLDGGSVLGVEEPWR